MSLNLADTEHSEVFTTTNDSKLLKFKNLLNKLHSQIPRYAQYTFQYLFIILQP